jgi:hypothetical protein
MSKHFQGYPVFNKLDGDTGAVARERDAKAKADALAARQAAAQAGVKSEPIPAIPPPPKITDMSDAELSATASAPDQLPDDPTSTDYLRHAEGAAARGEIFKRALNPAAAVRVR